MNDLERDLRNILHEDASRAPLVAAPPRDLRKNVRRRQVPVAIATGMAFAVVSVVAGAAWVSLSDRTATLPAGVDEGMTVTIDRFTIEAPAGWQAVDTSFLKLVTVTEMETCSSTGEAVEAGTDVPQDRAAGDGTQTCTNESVEIPAGIPVLQLAQDAPSDLDRTVCGPLSDGRGEGGNAFAGDRAGFYLALMPHTAEAPGWPVPLEPGNGPCGEGWYARFSSGDEAYLAFAGFGPDVPTARRDLLLEAVAAMELHDAAPADPSFMGAGVVVASGRVDDEHWQVTAGLRLAQKRDGGGSPPAVWLDSFNEAWEPTGQLVQTWDGGSGHVGNALGVGDRAIAIALIPGGADLPAWGTDDGSTTPLATVPAPALMSSGLDPFEGRVGWAVVPDARGEFRAP